jgi:hypothetical protein
VRVGLGQARATQNWSYIYRNSIRACRKWILYAAKHVLKWFYAIARRENCIDTRATLDLLIYYIRTGFGRVESESCMRQNACRKWCYAIARRENCICSGAGTQQDTRDTEVVDIYNNNIYRTNVWALQKWIRYTAKCLYVGNYAVERRDGRGRANI